ncbi:hypothetical protein ACQWFX_26230, partial [Salmonella enterica subsp. enterica serovar Infantis]
AVFYQSCFPPLALLFLTGGLAILTNTFKNLPGGFIITSYLFVFFFGFLGPVPNGFFSGVGTF